MSDLPDWLDVPRETTVKWQQYLDLLTNWNAKINLVSDKNEGDWWSRHILDSAQLSLYLPSSDVSIIDLGSGAGLPGIVLGLMGYHRLTLIESDKRKVAFLQHVCGTFSLPLRILSERVEAAPPLLPDYVVSRAFAPLPQLIEYSLPQLKESTTCLFHKGRNYSKEIEDVKFYHFDHFTHVSKVDPQSVVLEIKSIARS